jgi:hypothetical protein
MPNLDVDRLIKLHRAQFMGITETRGVGRLIPIYQQSRAELEARLGELKRRGRGDTFSAQHVRLVLVQVNDILAHFADAMRGHIQKQGKLAKAVASKHVVDEVKTFEKHFTGMAPVLQTAQVGVLRAISRGVEPALLNRYKASEAFYTVPVVKEIRGALALSLAQGETVDEAVDRVAGTSGVFAGQRWRAERIARTELAYTYGVTKHQTMLEIVRTDIPDLHKKLIETSDDREGEDSKDLNGQMRRVGEPFVWVVKDAHGKPTGKIVKYQAPPNRPHDRAVVIPWRPEWGDRAIGRQGEVDPSVPRDPDVGA